MRRYTARIGPATETSHCARLDSHVKKKKRLRETTSNGCDNRVPPPISPLVCHDCEDGDNPVTSPLQLYDDTATALTFFGIGGSGMRLRKRRRRGEKKLAKSLTKKAGAPPPG